MRSPGWTTGQSRSPQEAHAGRGTRLSPLPSTPGRLLGFRPVHGEGSRSPDQRAPVPGQNELQGHVARPMETSHWQTPLPVTSHPVSCRKLRSKTRRLVPVLCFAPPAISDEKREARVNESPVQGASIAPSPVCCKRGLAFFQNADPAFGMPAMSKDLTGRTVNWGRLTQTERPTDRSAGLCLFEFSVRLTAPGPTRGRSRPRRRPGPWSRRSRSS